MFVNGRLMVVVGRLVIGFLWVVIKHFAFLSNNYKYMEPLGQYGDPSGMNGSSSRSKSLHSLIFNWFTIYEIQLEVKLHQLQFKCWRKWWQTTMSASKNASSCKNAIYQTFYFTHNFCFILIKTSRYLLNLVFFHLSNSKIKSVAFISNVVVFAPPPCSIDCNVLTLKIMQTYRILSICVLVTISLFTSCMVIITATTAIILSSTYWSLTQVVFNCFSFVFILNNVSSFIQSPKKTAFIFKSGFSFSGDTKERSNYSEELFSFFLCLWPHAVVIQVYLSFWPT